MDISFPDVFGVNKNKKGVLYLYNIYSGEVIAKQCTRCGEWRFLNQFNKAGKGFAGTHSLCKSCQAERGKEYRFDLKTDAELNREVAEAIAKAIYEMESHDVYITARTIKN